MSPSKQQIKNHAFQLLRQGLSPSEAADQALRAAGYRGGLKPSPPSSSSSSSAPATPGTPAAQKP